MSPAVAPNEREQDEAAAREPCHRLRLDPTTTLRVPRNGREILIVSDLHLGPGEPSGFPNELVPALLSLLQDAASRGAILVLDGDVLDVGPEKERAAAILRRYPRLREGLQELGRHAALHYVAGNHDPALGELRALDLCQVASALVIDEVLVLHGHELDVGLSTTLVGQLGDAVMVVRRLMQQRIDVPLDRFDSLENRAVAAALLRVAATLDTRLTDPSLRAWLERNMTYLASLDAEQDPRFVVSVLADTKLPAGTKKVVCGHTHHPGIAELPGLTYFNAGTWSKTMATAVSLAPTGDRVWDVVTGRAYGTEAYARRGEPIVWRDWIANRPGGPMDLTPLAREAMDRLMGPLARFDVHATSTRMVESAAALFPKLPAGPTPEAPPPDGSPLGLRFQETLRGHYLLDGERAQRPLRLELCGLAERTRGATAVSVRGTIHADGLATRREIVGTLRLRARPALTLDYDLTFHNDDGGRLHLHGTKLPSLRAPIGSLTSMDARLVDDAGTPVADVQLEIDLERDLGAFLRSLSVSLPSDRAFARDPSPPPADAAHGREDRDRATPPRQLHVAVTGASGHLGYNLVRQLLARGHRVLALVRRPAGAPELSPLEALAHEHPAALELARADLLSPASLRAAIPEGLDRLFHVAGVLKFHALDDEREIVAPNVEGTAHVLRAARRAGVGRVVLTSSAAALGCDAAGRDPLDERDWNDGAKSAYQRSKTLAERRAWDLAEELGIDLVALQPVTFLGPNFYRHTAATRLVAEFITGRAPAVPPFMLPWVDVRDVALAHILAAEHDQASGRYPLVTVHLSFEQLLQRIVRIDPDFPVPSRKLPSALVPALPVFDWLQARLLGTPRVLDAGTLADIAGKELRVDATRARRELGWCPRAFDDTLAETLAWYRGRFA